MTVVKVQSASDVAARLGDGDILAFTGDATLMVPDAVLAAIEARFLETGHPRDITVVQPCNACLGPGTGIDRLAHKGLLRSLVTSILPPYTGTNIAERIRQGDVEVTLYPMGVLYSLVRESAAGRPGVLSKVGIGTFVERYIDKPIRFGREDKALITRMSVDGEAYLFFRALRADMAIIRGSTADESGNFSQEREPLKLDAFSMALLARASGGFVAAQVERCARQRSLDPRSVAVPARLVDAIVVAANAPQSSRPGHDAGLSNEIRISNPEPTPLKLVQLLPVRRVLEDFVPGDLVNLGVGVGSFCPTELANLGISDVATFVTEHGAYGGVPSYGDTFGAHYNAEALINPSEMFSIYTSGTLDHTVLGFAEVDAEANVNVSGFGGRTNGAGGFIDISSATRSAIFCGTFTTRGLEIERSGDGFRIASEGSTSKFVQTVSEVTFNAKLAVELGHAVKFVTERCVIEFGTSGWRLTEIAEGIRVREDVLERIPFSVAVADELRVWPATLTAQDAAVAAAYLRRLYATR